MAPCDHSPSLSLSHHLAHCAALHLLRSPTFIVIPFLCSSVPFSSLGKIPATTVSRAVQSPAPATALPAKTVSSSTGKHPFCPFPRPHSHFFSSRDCHICSQTICVARKNANKSNAGVSKGALAGGVVGALVFLALSFSLYFWYRRKLRLRKIIAKNREVQKDKPAPAEDVLSRPDPIEKIPNLPPQPVHTPANPSVDPESHGTTLPPPIRPQLISPFDDSHSIQTTRTEGTNAIPIALVSPEYPGRKTDTDTLPSTTSSSPMRPARSPDLNLNLEHVNVSHDNLRVPYAGSIVSGISGISRTSYMSNASYSSDFLHEAPIIVTANTGAVRQVLNVVKAEVVNTGPVSPHLEGLKPPTFASRPTVTSPLAATSFGPNDVLNEADESSEVVDPFDDTHSTTAQGSTSPAVKSFDRAIRPESTSSEWVPDGPTLPWTRSDDSRPSSISTQEGSIVNIGSATRVTIGLSGLSTPATISTIPRSSYRTTMGRLVSPLSGNTSQPGTPGTLQEQQVRAFALAQANAQAQGSKRVSGSSVVSAASTRADSILEAFPFVPPSPISDRPLRSPPISPLTKQSFTNSPASSLIHPTVTVAPPSPLNQQIFNTNGGPPGSQDDRDALPAPPDRRILGLSTGSQLSTTSTGLGSFPFQIDSGTPGDENTNSRPNTLSIRQRASLDTLALTSDLASYPLDFERDNLPLVSQRKI